MKSINKKEIKQNVLEALTQIVGTYQIEKPSKKTSRLIEKASRKISRELKVELRRQTKKMEKAGKVSHKGEAVAA